MRLSVCCLSAAPAAQLQAVLAPWRSVADEIVVGADRRLGADDQARYGQLADRIVPIIFDHLEAHLAELHAACSGDWILRVDADELPSEHLLQALPDLCANADVTQWALARRWIDPAATGWLDEQPWYPDWQVRLVRNAGLCFSGQMHSGPEPNGARGYCIAPLLHLDCALHDVQRRRTKAIVYDVQRPGLHAPGAKPMIAYYEPERWATRPAVPLDAADARAVGDILGRSVASADPRPGAPDRQPAEAGAIAIAVQERDLRWSPGEHRPLTCAFTNLGQDNFPAGASPDPPIFAAYRITDPDGTVRDGFRTPLPHPTPPGQTVVVPLLVAAPQAPGRYRLTVDLVHEHVRWFGGDCSVEIDVVVPPAPIDRREIRPARRRLARGARTPIPKILHQVWLGDAPVPDAHERWTTSWRGAHPDWELHRWTDADAPVVPEAQRARNLVERADIVRYEVLRRHGGVYVDTDMECVQPIDELLNGVVAFAGYEVPGRVCNAVLGGVRGHPAFEQLVAIAQRTVGRGSFPASTGPHMVTRVLEPLSDVTLFDPERFYPHLWDAADEPSPTYGPQTYAIHHWARSWLADD